MNVLTQKTRAVIRRLPLPVRQGLAALRDRTTDSYATLVGAMLRSAPVRSRTIVSERMTGPLGTVRPLDYDGGSILLHVDSLIELNTRLRSCAKEPETVRWIETFVKPGDVVFDIGANVGVYSFVIDRHSQGKAKVYAFEPSAATFVQLTRNVALNACENRVVPLPIAFGEQTRLATFNYSSTAPGAALHGVDTAVDAHGKSFVPAMRQPIMLFSIDEFVQRFGIESPTHMKIDVDGTELDILRGARKTIANGKLRSVMIELEPTSHAKDDATALLEGAGFRLETARSHGAATETTNYLFVRERA